VGKGIAAALLMANVQAVVTAFAAETVHPSEICTQLNRVLCTNLAPDKFVTFFYCVIDTAAKTLRYSNAGHCFPLLRRSRGAVEVLGDGGIVLGIFPDAKYSDVAVQMILETSCSCLRMASQRPQIQAVKNTVRTDCDMTLMTM
jgi:sigma-B regulation protein RsbU (phosphoserine phosphatase)